MPQHHLESIAFPTLDETQIAQLARCTTATPKACRDGQILFAVGERNAKFFIVKSGEVEVLDQSGDTPVIACAQMVLLRTPQMRRWPMR